MAKPGAATADIHERSLNAAESRRQWDADADTRVRAPVIGSADESEAALGEIGEFGVHIRLGHRDLLLAGDDAQLGAAASAHDAIASIFLRFVQGMIGGG